MVDTITEAEEGNVWPASGGPHGLGDPNDRRLRKVEKDILIPKRVRERSRKEKCVSEVIAFGKCSKESGMLNVIKCRDEAKVMVNCLEQWFNDKDFNEECKEQYLEERSEYRRTGMDKRTREKKNQSIS